ncbi:helix-turn-helix transcriptional regulator [Photobacterium japonica]|uniref:helix-turn-helix domain-containing protein n=1 Tax=Photobacterium japonica TaxID=2910235 RepID=UPI003D0A38B6
MKPHLVQLRQNAKLLEAQLEEVLNQIEQATKHPIPSYSLYSSDELVADMRARKKAISLEDLELQTDISASTLKRMLKDPRKTSLENFLTVANELGMKIWIEK